MQIAWLLAQVLLNCFHKNLTKLWSFSLDRDRYSSSNLNKNFFKYHESLRGNFIFNKKFHMTVRGFYVTSLISSTRGRYNLQKNIAAICKAGTKDVGRKVRGKKSVCNGVTLIFRKNSCSLGFFFFPDGSIGLLYGKIHSVFTSNRLCSKIRRNNKRRRDSVRKFILFVSYIKYTELML